MMKSEITVMDIVHSVNGVPIRMTAQRWKHIVENHNDLAGYYEMVLQTVEKPDLVIPGYGGTLIALKGLARRRYLGVIYREVSAEDGFIISAYFTSKIERRKKIWPK
jgi:hypothetical protein